VRSFDCSAVSEVRGKGLLNAVVISGSFNDSSLAWDICLRLSDDGKSC